MYAAYEALSDRMKVYLEGLTATHDGHATFSRYNPGGSYPRATHPRHQTRIRLSGRKALYVNRGFTTHINELPEAEGKALLAFLLDHCESPHWSTRLHWEEDTVAFWDNRCVQHLAIFDYFPHKRSGFRVQIAGETGRSRSRCGFVFTATIVEQLRGLDVSANMNHPLLVANPRRSRRVCPSYSLRNSPFS